MSTDAKERFCWNCGKSLGVIQNRNEFAVFITAAVMILLFCIGGLMYSLGAYSVAKDCDKAGVFTYSDRVYDCKGRPK